MADALWPGDRVDVVLDCLIEDDGISGPGPIARVFVRLVDAPRSEGGAMPGDVFPGARRNVKGAFLGVPMDDTYMAAFAIPLDGEAGSLLRVAAQLQAVFPVDRHPFIGVAACLVCDHDRGADVHRVPPGARVQVVTDDVSLNHPKSPTS